MKTYVIPLYGSSYGENVPHKGYSCFQYYTLLDLSPLVLFLSTYNHNLTKKHILYPLCHQLHSEYYCSQNLIFVQLVYPSLKIIISLFFMIIKHTATHSGLTAMIIIMPRPREMYTLVHKIRQHYNWNTIMIYPDIIYSMSGYSFLWLGWGVCVWRELLFPLLDIT